MTSSRNNQNQQPLPTPSLQAPGAGLPFLESLIVRYYYGGYVSKKTSVEQNFKMLCLFTSKILKSIEGLTSEQLERKILIPRISGIEDSSRFWSIAMTLEHLVIVGTNMKYIISELSHNRVPPLKVDISKVKPLGSKSSTEYGIEFKKKYENIELDLKKEIGTWNSKAKLYHPWIGRSTAQQWFWLMASHQGIHYHQIKQILKRL